MARKIKFALKMADGAEVRNIDELKEHFDVEKVVAYFTDGRLLNWLKSRYYDEEADKVKQLTADDPQLHKKLCAIFGVESEVEELDAEEIARRQERLNRLKQYTYDKEILERVDVVAFDQEDFSDLLDEERPLIYLCNNKFVIPLRETYKTYIGIGKAIAVIRSNKIVDFDALKIKFKNVLFDDKYAALLKECERAAEAARPKKLFDEGEAADRAGDFETALEKFKQAAELGYPKAFSSIGFLYELGNGNDIDKDVNEARRWFKLGMEKDDADSFRGYAGTFNSDDSTEEEKREAFRCMKRASELKPDDGNILDSLGYMYQFGKGTSKNLAKAFECYEKGASAGDTWATFSLAEMYANGEHVAKNLRKAFELYERAVEIDEHGYNIYAIKALADCYYYGKGVKKNLREAFELYKRAAKFGDAEIMNIVGNMYYLGKGTIQDKTEAYNWYKKSAEGGNLWGMYNLSHAYRRGKGTAKDVAEGIRWLEKAANNGLIEAATRLGYLYRDGDGVPKDYFKAAGYFKHAAEQGDGDAMNGLGLLYDWGQGVKEDKKLAFQWFLRAAEAGDLSGKANAGHYYLLGIGTSKDMVKAGKWLNEAAESGHYWGMVYYGDYFFETEHYGKALNWYKKAYDATKGSDAGRAAYKIGEVYKKTGEIKKSGGILKNNMAARFIPGAKLAVHLMNLNNSSAKADLKESERWFEKAKKLGYKHDDGCFITTAVCENLGKPDDCYELTTFRNFRDGWLTAQPDGKALIAEYYSIAPRIVDQINRLPDAAQVYETLCKKYLSPCLKFIERGDNQSCKRLYVEMVTSLKKKFLGS